MENEQQPTQYNYQEPPKRRGISTGAAIVLGISGIIIAAIIAGAIIFASGTKTIRDIDFENFDGLEISVDENGEETIVNVNVNQNTSKKITRGNYSFEAPANWSESAVEFEGCDWFNISNDTSDGMRMAGEIGIYPVSCFDMSKSVGHKENTVVDGYYILAYYDQETGTTENEIRETREVYENVVVTFEAAREEQVSFNNCSATDSPSITITSPAGGEVYSPGEEVAVRWTSCNVPSTYSTSIFLSGFESMNSPYVWSADVADGLFMWTVPDMSNLEMTQFSLGFNAQGVRATSETFKIQ